jgi:WD40 repeat protein
MALPFREPLEAAFDVELPPAPYPGLRPFNTEEWPVFFGREQMTDEVIRRWMGRHLVVVHGDSGCGKSSLIRAGVLAQLEQERARSGVRWRTANMLPREAPLRRLAETIAEIQGAAHNPDYFHQVRRTLNHGVDAPAALAELLRGGKDDHICILVDQFEELFSFASVHGPEEAQLFVDILVGLQENPPPGLYIILTMRSEFLGVCARFKGLAEAVNQTQYLLPQMERPALMRAIREPALLYEGEVSRELAERLIADAGGGQDQLPLIQHGLMLLWQRKSAASSGLAEAASPYMQRQFELAEPRLPFRYEEGPAWRLGLEDYQGSGLTALLSDHADQVMAEAAPDARREKVVEHLFRGLTDINAEGNAVRRPQTMVQLVAVTGSDEQTLRDIIDHFRADGVSFLRPYGDEAIEPDGEIDISHEALIRCWQRIADEKEGWLQREFRDGLIWKTLRMQAQRGETLAATATEARDAWLRTLPSPGWSERYDDGWDDVQRLMIASRKARDEELQRKRELEEAQRREAEERARRAEEAHRAAAEIAAKQQELREAQERIAEEQRQRAEAEQDKAAEAEARATEADAGRRRSRRLAIVAGVFGFVALCAFVVAAGMWWQASRAEARAQLGDSLYRAVQARNELEDARPVTAMQLALAGLPEDTQAPSAHPWVGEAAGALIEAMGAQRELKVLRGHEGPVLAAGFSPDGARIVSGSDDNTVRVRDAQSGAELLVLRGHKKNVFATGFSPDGARIVSGSWDNTVRVWDAASGAELLVLRGHERPVWAAGFSPDGARIVSGSSDATVRVWDAASGAELLVPRGREGAVSAAGFSPDGARLVSGSAEGTVRVWDARSGAELLVMPGHEEPVWAVRFSPDGSRIVSGSEDNTVRVWDAASGAELLVLRDHNWAVRAVGFSPDGARLVSGADDKTVRVWDAKSGAKLMVLRGHEGIVRAAGFSPDGARIVSGSADNTTRVWDAQGGAQLLVLRGHGRPVLAAGFSPGGARIVSGSAEGTVRVWDAASGAELMVLRGHEGPVRAAEFSPDGARLLSGSADKTVRVWDAASGAELLVLRGYERNGFAAGFSPDGARLVSGSKDGTLRITWIGRSKQELIETARARLPRELTEEERRRFYLAVE